MLGRRSREKQTKAGLRGARDTLGPSIHLKEGGPKDGEVRNILCVSREAGNREI